MANSLLTPSTIEYEWAREQERRERDAYRREKEMYARQMAQREQAQPSRAILTEAALGGTAILNPPAETITVRRPSGFSDDGWECNPGAWLGGARTPVLRGPIVKGVAQSGEWKPGKSPATLLLV